MRRKKEALPTLPDALTTRMERALGRKVLNTERVSSQSFGTTSVSPSVKQISLTTLPERRELDFLKMTIDQIRSEVGKVYINQHLMS